MPRLDFRLACPTETKNHSLGLGSECAIKSRRIVANASFVQRKISPIALASTNAVCGATHSSKRLQGKEKCVVKTQCLGCVPLHRSLLRRSGFPIFASNRVLLGDRRRSPSSTRIFRFDNAPGCRLSYEKRDVPGFRCGSLVRHKTGCVAKIAKSETQSFLRSLFKYQAGHPSCLSSA